MYSHIDMNALVLWTELFPLETVWFRVPNVMHNSERSPEVVASTVYPIYTFGKQS